MVVKQLYATTGIGEGRGVSVEEIDVAGGPGEIGIQASEGGLTSRER